MAKALKCDRCGKFYLYNSTKSGDTVLSGVAPITTRDTWYKRYDLCDDCITKFLEFMCGLAAEGEE